MTEPSPGTRTRAATIRRWLLTRDPNRHLPWRPILEIGLIVMWAMWLGRDYLSLAPDMWPNGREFGLAIHPHYVWTQLKECGSCVLWNGFYNGGSPTFVELHAAVLHPLVILSTLIWGGLNGAKMIIIGSLAMAGIGQWWLAKTMNLGWVARLWSAGMAAAGGHLAGRMEIGVVGVIVSTAACSLIIAPGLKLARSGKRRDVIPFAVVLALAILSGQGYLQIGLLVSVIPAFAILMVDDHLQIRPVWKEFVLAGVLAILLAAPFVIPFLHFWPQFGKDIDPNFTAVQPLEYIPLNFVIRNPDLYYTDQLGKLPYPYLYLNFIGWTPLLLALLPLRLARKQERRLLTFFVASVGLVLLASSALTFKQIGKFLPDLVTGIRYPSLIAGLAVPLILGLAAWGVDHALKLKWMVLPFAPADNLKHPKANAWLSWFILVMVLILALRSVYTFSRSWLFTALADSMVAKGIEAVKSETESAQWIAFPLGEHFWAPAAAEAGLKLTQQARPSHWKERPVPLPYLAATRAEINPNEVSRDMISVHAGLTFIEDSQNQYAFITTDENGEAEPCTAVAQGGHITVNCTTTKPGILTVQENRWSGWQAWQDGNRISINNQSRWLTVNAPAGDHQYQFHYLPWDVIAGFITMFTGITLAILIWLKAPEN